MYLLLFLFFFSCSKMKINAYRGSLSSRNLVDDCKKCACPTVVSAYFFVLLHLKIYFNNFIFFFKVIDCNRR